MDVTFTAGSCAKCKHLVYWQECPTGGWWIHNKHPKDNHDAVVMKYGKPYSPPDKE